MPKYLVEVHTTWSVEVEADDPKWAATVAVEEHSSDSTNISSEDTYVEEVQ